MFTFFVIMGLIYGPCVIYTGIKEGWSVWKIILYVIGMILYFPILWVIFDFLGIKGSSESEYDHMVKHFKNLTAIL